MEALIARFARGRDVSGATTLEELGLSSLERVELMVALEDRFQTRIDEARFAEALQRRGSEGSWSSSRQPRLSVEEPVDFPSWNRSWPARLIRRLSLATWILPLARVFAHVTSTGLEHLRGLDGPVVFASNHQSHMDVPVILAALPGRWRARVAPAMLKEFFKAHFFPGRPHLAGSGSPTRCNYYLAALYFNAFPLPQREAGARQTLQYIGELAGDGWSIADLPGRPAVDDRRHQGIPRRHRHDRRRGSSVPVVPVRIDGVDRVLHQTGSH